MGSALGNDDMVFVGISVGFALGARLGICVGIIVGMLDGDAVGVPLGFDEGKAVGAAVGPIDGEVDGLRLICLVGFEVGGTDGELDSDSVGLEDGTVVLNLDPPHVQHASVTVFEKFSNSFVASAMHQVSSPAMFSQERPLKIRSFPPETQFGSSSHNDGDELGIILSAFVGDIVGRDEGMTDGSVLGALVGLLDGDEEGNIEFDGVEVGFKLG